MKRVFFGLSVEPRRIPGIWLFAIGLASLMIVVLILIAYVKYDTVNELRVREQDLRRQVNALQAVKKQYQELEQRVQGLQKKLGKINKLATGGSRALHQDLVAVTRAIPDDAKLRSLNFDTHWLECEGSAKTVHAVTTFLERLSAQERFKDPRLLAVGSGQVPDEKKVPASLPVTFKIRMQRGV